MLNAFDTELLVIGAGPAGLAAATTAAALGIDTVLMDEQAAPGGQIYRALSTSPLPRPQILGQDYLAGQTLIDDFMAGTARYQPNAMVWSITPFTHALGQQGFHAVWSEQGTARRLRARHILLATGAQERPVPLPGWTLPGVMMAGAAQIALKTSGLVPDQNVVLAGSGPLLYLLAWQYQQAGAPVTAVLDTTPPGRWATALDDCWDFLRSPYFRKGLALVRQVRAHTRVIHGVTGLQALGNEAVNAVRYSAGGHTYTIDTPLLLLHQGVIPNINLPQAAGATLRWNTAQACWEPACDPWGQSNVTGLHIAGDGAGIAGAQVAAERGRLAALDAAMQLGCITLASRNAKAAASRRALARAMRGRRFLDTYFRPADAFRYPAGDTVVCRCEEISAQDICRAVALGCTGPNQLKAFLRCGMGPCQGRFCDVTVTELVARERGISPGEAGHYRRRFPTKPVTLGELASLPTNDAARAVVQRSP